MVITNCLLLLLLQLQYPAASPGIVSLLELLRMRLTLLDFRLRLQGAKSPTGLAPPQVPSMLKTQGRFAWVVRLLLSRPRHAAAPTGIVPLLELFLVMSRRMMMMTCLLSLMMMVIMMRVVLRGMMMIDCLRLLMPQYAETSAPPLLLFPLQVTKLLRQERFLSHHPFLIIDGELVILVLEEILRETTLLFVLLHQQRERPELLLSWMAFRIRIWMLTMTASVIRLMIFVHDSTPILLLSQLFIFGGCGLSRGP
jgi:hypothetical protein